AKVSRGNVRRVQETARCHGRGLEQDQGFLLPLAEGRVLRFPKYHRDRMAVEKTGRRAPRPCRSRCAVWNRVRRFRRRLFALQRGQLDREHREGTRSRRRLGEEESVNKTGSGRVSEERRKVGSKK